MYNSDGRSLFFFFESFLNKKREIFLPEDIVENMRGYLCVGE